MPKTYELADESLHKAVRAVMKQYHKPLTDAGVTVTVMLCRGGLAWHGYPAAAVVKINSLKDRVEGKADCTVTLNDDGEGGWLGRREQERAAVIDHELTHLYLVKDDKGNVEEDDAGRPKLKMRLHDIQIGGFAEIIERHRESAIEAQQLWDNSKWVQGDLFKW